MKMRRFMLGDASHIPVPKEEDEPSPRKKREAAKGSGPNKAAKSAVRVSP